MSRLLHLSLWLDDRPIDRQGVEQLLTIVAGQNRTADEAIFRDLAVYDGDLSNVAQMSRPLTSRVEDVMAALPLQISDSMAIEVAATYDSVGYDDVSQALVQSKRRLVAKRFGPKYGWQGLYFKSFGAVRLDWYSIKNFGVPIEVVEAARQPSRADTNFMQMIPILRQNYSGPLQVARELIAAFKPRHLVIYSDLDLNPLTAHTIYHREIEDFARDLDAIVALHEHGGLYFTSVQPDHPAFVPPRRLTASYGYLRSELGADWVDEITTRIDTAAAQHSLGVDLPPDEIRQALTDTPGTTTELLGNGALVTATDAPFDYVEEPFFRLFALAAQTVH